VIIMGMNLVLLLSVIWTVYGIAGILGFQKIPPEYQDRSWSKNYSREQGLSFLMLGLPWLIFDRALAIFSVEMNPILRVSIIIVLAIPSIFYTSAIEKKYKALLATEEDEEDT